MFNAPPEIQILKGLIQEGLKLKTGIAQLRMLASLNLARLLQYGTNVTLWCIFACSHTGGVLFLIDCKQTIAPSYSKRKIFSPLA